jgi:integrase
VKALLRENEDPVAARRLNRAAASSAVDDTFEAVAERWLAKQEKEWGPAHFKKSARAFERDVYPTIGNLRIAEVTCPMVATVVEAIYKRGALETATRVLDHVKGEFQYAQAKGLCRDNVAEPAGEVLPHKKQNRHLSALLALPALGRCSAARRSGSLIPVGKDRTPFIGFQDGADRHVVSAEWHEFRLEDEPPVWVIPREKMKMAGRDFDHRIPLCPQIADELRRWRQLAVDGAWFSPHRRAKDTSAASRSRKRTV